MVVQMNLTKRNLGGTRPANTPGIPTGEGFATGLIGPTMLTVAHNVFTNADPIDYNKHAEDGATINAMTYVKTRNGNGWRMNFATRADADAALALLGDDVHFPSLVAQVELDMTRVLNIGDDARAKFGDTMEDRIDMKSLRSKKRRHAFHLIWLPAFVSAVARSYGAELPAFDLSALQDANFQTRGDNAKPVEEVFTDEFFAHMCGDPDDKDGWMDSVLGIQRAAEWAELGEKNPANCRLEGPGATEAPQLYACLDQLFTWSTEIWCRVDMIPNPSVDKDGRYVDDGGKDKQRTILCITEMFVTEADALEAAAKENSDRAARVDVSAQAETEDDTQAETETTKPVMPGGEWADLDEGDWVDALNAVPELSTPAAAKELGAPAPSIVAWRKYLG